MAISILLADDSPTIAKILSLALASEEYEIEAVETADDAERMLKHNPPHIFLVDYALPEKDAFVMTQFVRNDPKLSHIKIAVLANAFDSIEEGTVKAKGADTLIIKPFDPSELRSKLKEILALPPIHQRVFQPVNNSDVPEISKPNINTPMFATIPIDIEHHLDVSESLKEVTKNLKVKLPVPPLMELVRTETPSIELAVSDWQPLPQQSNLNQWQAEEEDGEGLFDTGKSTFRFSADYIERIKYPATDKEEVPRNTDMEKMIREEVQTACKNAVEKVAQELLPELAENVIRRELERVLKQIDAETQKPSY